MTTLASRLAARKKARRAYRKDALRAIGELLHGPSDLEPPKKRQHTRREDPHHIACKNYLEATLPDDWIVHHSRNGGLSKAENGRAKEMGTKVGYHDLIIHGTKDVGTLTPIVVPWSWLIEIKIPDDPKSQLSTEQRKLHAKFKALGFDQAVARSIDDVRDLVLSWGLPSNDHLVVAARERGSR